MSFLKRKTSAASQGQSDKASGSSSLAIELAPSSSSASVFAAAASAPALEDDSLPASALGAEQDVQLYLQKIARIVDEYQRLHKKAQELKKLPIPRNHEGPPARKLRDSKAEVLTKRKELKESFIQNKQLARTVMKGRLPPQRVAMHESRLKGLQQSFRDFDTGIKEMDLMGDAKGSGALKSAGSMSSGLAILAGADTARSDSSLPASSRTDGSSGRSGLRGTVGKVLSVAGSAVTSVLPHGSSASSTSSVAIGTPGTATPGAAIVAPAPGSAILDDEDAALDAAEAAAKSAASSSAYVYVPGQVEGEEDEELWGTVSGGGGGGGVGIKGGRNRPLGSHRPKTNKDYLDDALATQQNTVEKLREGQRAIEQSREVGAQVTGTLEEDREKIDRISTRLDEVQGELAISRKLLVNFTKRLATDKVIVALSFLIVCAIVFIIVWAATHPGQKLFNVPEAVKPPLNPNARR